MQVVQKCWLMVHMRPLAIALNYSIMKQYMGHDVYIHVYTYTLLYEWVYMVFHEPKASENTTHERNKRNIAY